MKFWGWLCVTLLATSASAATDTSQSHIGFVFKQMNVPVAGHFKRFTADVRFDARRPEASRAAIAVDLASIDTGTREADEEAQGPDWFDTRRTPTAKFVSTAVRRPTPDRYEVAGELSIKGRTRTVTIPIQVERKASTIHYTGSFTLKRLDYAIGEGIWADTATVADEVEVRFRIVQADRGT